MQLTMGLLTVNRLAAAFRIRQFDLECADARADERHRRATLTGLTAAIARIVAVATSLITVPITLSYLGAERFGLWMAISSVLAIMNFADLGIGNGVMNAVADAHGKNDIQGIQVAITSGMAVLVGIAALLLAALAVTYWQVDWASLFNVRSPIARIEAGPALLVAAVFFVLNIPAGLVQRAQMGLQEGFRSYVWQLAGSLTGLSGVLLAVHWHGGLPWLLFALAGSPAIVAIMNGFVFFGWMRRDLLPSLTSVSRSGISKVGRLGVLFFVLQLVVALAFSSDNFIVARVLGPEAATQYAIPQRMFMLVSVMLAMLMAPLWPAYAEAISRGDTHWVQKTLVRSLKLVTLVASAAVLVLVCFGKQIIHLWVGKKVSVSLLLLSGLAVWTLFDVAGNAVGMFLNGASVIRYQVIVSLIFSTLCLSAKIYAARHFGIASLPWATASTYCLAVAAPYAILLPRLLRRVHEERASSVGV